MCQTKIQTEITALQGCVLDKKTAEIKGGINGLVEQENIAEQQGEKGNKVEKTASAREHRHSKVRRTQLRYGNGK